MAENFNVESFMDTIFHFVKEFLLHVFRGHGKMLDFLSGQIASHSYLAAILFEFLLVVGILLIFRFKHERDDIMSDINLARKHMNGNEPLKHRPTPAISRRQTHSLLFGALILAILFVIGL